MKRIVMILVLIVSSFFGYAEGLDINDAKLREILARTFIDLHPVKRHVEATLADINFASNRLVNAAKAVYEEESSDVRQKRRALTVVSSYGTPADVDFLISCSTNKEHWSNAALGTLLLLGPTTNAIDKIEQLMQINCEENGVDVLEQDKGWAIQCLLQKAKSSAVELEDMDRAWHFALNFATNHVNLAGSMDSELKRFNPAYEHSRTRKGLLTYWHACPANEYCRDYVARELGALNQIPESELDE